MEEMSNGREPKASLLLSARMLTYALALTMSANATAGDAAQPHDATLLVTDTGQYVLSGKPVALADLRARLRELKSSGGPVNLRVAGGPKAEYKPVAQALQVAQEEGLVKVAFVMAPVAAPQTSASPSSK